jgi:beta-lactamase superfamily II metal-dependent hydrolase
LADLTILDVGHGNCAVLHDDKGVIIIDACEGDTLFEFLEQRGVTAIDAILISHADMDHLAGVLALMTDSELVIGAVYFNTETNRETRIWQAFRRALSEARKRQATRGCVALTTDTSADFDRGSVRLEVLAPTPEIAASGAGGQDLDGRRLTANAMSAVVRIVCDGIPEVLLPADLDASGLDRMLADCPEPVARVLVFPHHGGQPARANAFGFAVRLCSAVRPDLVVFSIGRGMHSTPQPAIVGGVRAAAPAAHIACTQLSERCAASLPTRLSTHLDERPARGRIANACCAGTVEIRLGQSDPVYTPARTVHGAFVSRQAPTAVCAESPIEEATTAADRVTNPPSSELGGAPGAARDATG